MPRRDRAARALSGPVAGGQRWARPVLDTERLPYAHEAAQPERFPREGQRPAPRGRRHCATDSRRQRADGERGAPAKRPPLPAVTAATGEMFAPREDYSMTEEEIADFTKGRKKKNARNAKKKNRNGDALACLLTKSHRCRPACPACPDRSTRLADLLYVCFSACRSSPVLADRRTALRSAVAARSSSAVLFSTGWRAVGAISASGTRTNLRSAMRG